MSKNIVPCGGFELGDSLEIKDGKLDLVDGAGGGGGVLVVTILEDKAIEGKYTANKTFAEIAAFIENGGYVVASTSEGYMSMGPYIPNNNVQFSGIAEIVVSVMYMIKSDDSVTHVARTLAVAT